MIEEKRIKDWSSNENLPRGFTDWLDITIREIETQQKKGFRQIVFEFGVKPANLSRWIGGLGPMTQTNIRLLASPAVYTFPGFPRPIIDGTLTENITEPDRVPPSPLR